MRGFIKVLCWLSLLLCLSARRWQFVLIVPIFLSSAFVTVCAIYVFVLIIYLLPIPIEVNRDYIKPKAFFSEAWDTFWNVEL